MVSVVFGLLLFFMVSISNSVVRRTAMVQLQQMIMNNSGLMDVEGNEPKFSEEFVFYGNGVSTLVYSKSGALLAGQLPVSVTASVPFENGMVRTIEFGRTSYLVLDLWIARDWENGFWLRGLLEEPNSGQTARNLLYVALIALPLFLLLTAFVGYWILRRAFRPLNHITKTAENINEARDLSRRIGLPAGKDEFSRLAAVFDALFERLETSFEAEKQFTADASHELRTPVAIIKGACEYGLKYEETPEERKETLSIIYRQSERMSKLISGLLSMARLDQGVENVHKEIVDLGKMAEEVCDAREDIRDFLVWNLEPEVTVKGDAALLSRLLENLLDNGVKYGLRQNVHKEDCLQAECGSQIEVTVSCKDREAQLAVRDYGPGIPADQQDKIWQRFYQVDSSRSEESGLGLGLAMVWQIARIHGGYMTLVSEEGQGCCFTLHLPVTE